MTDLIDRYLAAIARELPEAQRADITAELRDELMSGLEAKEDSLGRPLTVTELETALRDFGNPLVVAGRYRRIPHLIGPEVFPFWWQTTKVTLTVIAAVYVVLIVLALLVQEPAERAIPSPVEVLLFAFGTITILFAMLERYGKPEQLARKWRPSRLPPAQGKTKGRFEIMVEMGMTTVALAWWTGLIHFQNVMPGTGLRVDLAPVWAAWFWPILGYMVFELVVNGHALLRPARVRVNGGLAIVRALAGAGITFGVHQADHYVDVSSTRLSPEALAIVQANFDRGFEFGTGVAVAVFLAIAVAEAWRLRRFLRINAGPKLA